jgi:predicted HicB family RNase H-like nuclease
MPAKTLRSPHLAILTAARKAAKTATKWEELHNAIFGPEGLTQTLKTPQQRQAFLDSTEGKEVWGLIDHLRASAAPPVADVSGKFLVRLPKSIHAALIIEAEQEGTSLNQLIVAKLSVSLNRVTAH